MLPRHLPRRLHLHQAFLLLPDAATARVTRGCGASGVQGQPLEDLDAQLKQRRHPAAAPPLRLLLASSPPDPVTPGPRLVAARPRRPGSPRRPPSLATTTHPPSLVSSAYPPPPVAGILGSPRRPPRLGEREDPTSFFHV
ncbi:hypothetical protein SEVIR_8G070075v4 [Setaria viridis]|uniref:Uncharacterized protein n=1 Tax=Setaria viridis TaxID=4556 RepID=A0A4U6TCM9_SETVI|nr:hypothetical protein SEVIR_8G070075v2 [Setaria viridis]